MTTTLGTAPVLSTLDTHILNEITAVTTLRSAQELSDDQLVTKYEIERTVKEIKLRRWSRLALQFPDEMLRDSPRVFQMLARRLKVPQTSELEDSIGQLTVVGNGSLALDGTVSPAADRESENRARLTILADTSYGSCCVDEIAAEHVDAEAVVHYGRACLSPTARLPVVHIFTDQDLDRNWVVESFRATFPAFDSKVIMTADMPYANHVLDICQRLGKEGYVNVFPASIIHDPASPIPNRTIPDSVQQDPSTLANWHLFHLSDPPTSLLLSLSSRVGRIYIFPTSAPSSEPPKSLLASSSSILRRRYALVTSLATVSIWGILINTLSVKNYLHIVDHVKSQIAASGKKSYMIVVGKLNAAKVANFSEIGGWVVIGCWESSLVDSKDFYKPVITPFELELALRRDEDRMWTGEWRGDFQGILDDVKERAAEHARIDSKYKPDGLSGEEKGTEEYQSEEESEPPEFDLRTGKLVSHSRPMRTQQSLYDTKTEKSSSMALARRAQGDIVAVNGIASPAAEYLKSKRTWRGLGSDFEIKYEEDQKGSAVEEGRTGIARGYAVGESARS